ncbi:Glutathione S-transferase zeta-1 [Cichlidogyrus casuarinus]|uniref:Glutathione S-transferase zeta-1 n=1 Tax=Cichlidogyrus casuarinus TaxID=1844966 RepID=A0ABD2Q9J5_9PLAT
MTTLYSYFRSSCSYRVRIALNLKKVDYNYKAVNLIKDGGEQFKQEYRNVNPKCEVPCLKIDGMTIYQSVAIIEYLEETRSNSGQRLLPDCLKTRAQVRMIVELINSGIQPIQNLGILGKVQKLGGDKIKWAQVCIESGFDAIEKCLTETSGVYCVGDEITMADVFLVPQVYNAKRYDVDVSKYPNIERINQKLLGHSDFQAATPENQPDAKQ